MQCIYGEFTKESDELSAVKVINKARLYQSEVDIIRSEAEILMKLVDNDHIVQIKNVSIGVTQPHELHNKI